MTTKYTPTKPLRKIDGTISLSPSLKKFAKPLIGLMLLLDFACAFDENLALYLTPLMFFAIMTGLALFISAKARGYFKYQQPQRKAGDNPKVLLVTQTMLAFILFAITFFTAYFSGIACKISYALSFFTVFFGFVLIGSLYPEYRMNDVRRQPGSTRWPTGTTSISITDPSNPSNTTSPLNPSSPMNTINSSSNYY